MVFPFYILLCSCCFLVQKKRKEHDVYNFPRRGSVGGGSPNGDAVVGARVSAWKAWWRWSRVPLRLFSGQLHPSQVLLHLQSASVLRRRGVSITLSGTSGRCVSRGSVTRRRRGRHRRSPCTVGAGSDAKRLTSSTHR